MAPGSKSRLAILRTSTIFIRVASILTHFEVVQPKVRVRWFIASRREKGLGRPAVPPRTGIRRWQWSPIVKHSIFRISFACHGMQMSGSCRKSLPAMTLLSQAKSETFSKVAAEVRICQAVQRNKSCTRCGRFCIRPSGTKSRRQGISGLCALEAAVLMLEAKRRNFECVHSQP